MTPRAAYDVLGLAPEASPDEVHAAFRRLARERHPDVGGSKDAFDELRIARDVALADAYSLPCGECGGRGKVNVSNGFHTVTRVCASCSGRGKRFPR